mmetsp:Transcript_80620/g.224347  ORF Transcript_80620/g.224347 Transcript_80620/m.224347 type:complete len:103 (+) Transcript_80620:792-1100(+)
MPYFHLWVVGPATGDLPGPCSRERGAPARVSAAGGRHHAEVALEGPSQEAAAWREQAYRSESALRTMLGEDVAGGLRALNKSCERHVQLDVGNSVEAVPSTC